MSVTRAALAELATIIMGQSPPGESYNKDGDGIPLLNGPTEFGDRHPVAKQWTNSPTKLCQSGDILFCVRGATAGRINIADKEYCLGRGLAAIRGRKGKLYTGFLRHVLANGYRLFQSRGVGSTFINISVEELGKFEVPLLSVAEQRRIAEVLDRTEALRAKRRMALAKLDDLVQSAFLKICGDPSINPRGWPVSRLGDLLESATYGTSQKAGSIGNWPVLRMNNLTVTGDMDLSDLKYMDLSKTEEDRYLVRAGDVLFNRTNSAELVGKTAVFREAERMAYAGYLIRLRTSCNNDPEYLSGLLNSRWGKRTLRSMCKSIVGMANINATEIQSLRIPHPPLEVQREYAHVVVTVRRLKVQHRESLKQLDTLFASLQHRAFRGEL